MIMAESHDPIEKLDQLRSWLANNRVGEYGPQPVTRKKITSEFAKQTSMQASREVLDFEQWVNDIQWPTKVSWA